MIGTSSGWNAGCSSSVADEINESMSALVDTVNDVRTIDNLDVLALLCMALGAGEAGGLAEVEQELVDRAIASEYPVEESLMDWARNQILAGKDPLGDAYCRLVSPLERRPLGQTFTPEPIIASMVSWASTQGSPVRIVDPGAGSGRYLLAAARQFPDATILGAEIDPMATLMLRANIAASGLQDRATAHLGDYRMLELPEVDGPTLFLGNPPYVRHHQIAPEWKLWLQATAKSRGLNASGLAGLHVHFFLATAQHGRPGDYGAFITSAEWLDVNYGKLVRELLLDGLGATSLHVLDAEAAPFADATTTGAISCFKIGEQPETVLVRRVETVAELGALDTGRSIARQRLAEANRWSVLTRVTPKLPEGYMELGELCRVHRGQVTGANNVWVTRDSHIDLPEEVLFPSITKALELFNAGERLDTSEALKRVIDLPTDLDELDAADKKRVERFLRKAKKQGVHQGYIASKRKAWWSVGLRTPAPVLATYMARRPPAFVRNDVEARHINIAHGLYPRVELDTLVLDRLATHLRSAVNLTQGRTYAGGLTKFEPKEMERLPIPSLEVLSEGVSV